MPLRFKLKLPPKQPPRPKKKDTRTAAEKAKQKAFGNKLLAALKRGPQRKKK